MEIHLEDHYYDKTDAAVVFKRYDRHTEDTRYVYHGNDGTSFPWNDTAQLDYLKAEVREAVIQTILHVARNFPVIRFDAAMTLAKKHIQRLWFPEPGAGGAIPSRSEHGMTRAEFDDGDPGGVLARSGGSCCGGSPGYVAPRRGILAAGRLFCPHAGNASRLQLGVHAHAARRRQRQISHGDQEHAGVRSANPQALRQLHEQPR